MEDWDSVRTGLNNRKWWWMGSHMVIGKSSSRIVLVRPLTNGHRIHGTGIFTGNGRFMAYKWGLVTNHLQVL